ncbi:MAG TPA: helix-turn-helix domain-containing protein [Solirubrobacteraceae bacterium]|nr:helix-turn-helix domain-containing protein [Solirubrobacteraceae bacterium]
MPSRPHADGELSLPLPAALLDALVDAIADRVAARFTPPNPGLVSPWMDFEAARAYLGFSRDTLYKLTAAGAIPHRKKAGGHSLRFHQAELDAWMEEAYPRVDSLPGAELRSAVFSLNQAENR